jgi:hypothetical protein
MTATVTLELPEDILVAALRKLSPARRRHLLVELDRPSAFTLRTVPAAELDKLTGLIAVGGDALEDSERLYEDASGD